MKLHGHWFCEVCDDVVTLPMPDDSLPIEAHWCPVCHRRAAIFVMRPITPKTVSPSRADELFNQMREATK